LYAVPVLVLIVARGMKANSEHRKVDFRLEEGRVDSLELGRLHEIFSSAEPSTLSVFLGCCFGLQIGLLYFTADHAGVSFEPDLTDSFLLSVDNLCHGVFFHLFDLFNVYVGAKVTYCDTMRSRVIIDTMRAGATFDTSESPIGER
jgi:hypothetical protein